ncbi:MAG: PhoU domain-containing protein [Methanosarcinaceae archaeon]
MDVYIKITSIYSHIGLTVRRGIPIETRKVQKTGGSTYIISLPKQWADRVGIQTGSRVAIHANPDGTLTIATMDTSTQSKRKRMDVTGCMGDALTRNLIAAYIAGYDIIELTGERILAEQKKVIRNVCHKLIGPEIIEENARNVVIQDLLNRDEVSIKKSVRRMFLISNSMHEEAMQALKSGETDLAMDVIQRDDEVDRLFLLISKQFRSVLRGARLIDTSKMNIDEYYDLRMVATSLERIADHALRIATVAQTRDYSIPDPIMELITTASRSSRKIVEGGIDALYGRDVELANRIIDSIDDMRIQINVLNAELLTIDSVEAAVALGSVADSIDRTADYGVNIAESAINLTIAIMEGEK